MIETQQLDGNELVTLMAIDFSTCIGFKPTGNTLLFISANRNADQDIVYDGNTYQYVGFDTKGFRSEINGGIPVPTIIFDKASLFANAQYIALWDEYILQTGQDYFDPRGAKVNIIRVMNLNTLATTDVQEFVVSQSTKITQDTVEWQLAVSLGIDRANNNSIQTLSVNRCSLRYRIWDAEINAFTYTNEEAGGCPYGNPTSTNDWSAVPNFGTKYYTNEDQELDPVNKKLDKCSYSALGCQLRFDPNKVGLVLPFVMLYSPNIMGTTNV
jgi:phage-related protein